MVLNSNSIGNKIAAARKKINLSQADLAQQVSISSQAVGKWERGESMPDIITLNRLAEILGVDLNYFSENFQSVEVDNLAIEKPNQAVIEDVQSRPDKKHNWDMSKLNLMDSDFSGLKNLHEKFSSSNIQRCLFVGANMSGLHLNSNNIESCNFSESDISNSQIHNSNIDKCLFKACSLKGTSFLKNNISKCDFSDADFTQTKLKWSNFGNNIVSNAIWNNTAFIEMSIENITFEGTLEDCFFEHSDFYGVKFQNATLLNTFFKNNDRMKRVQFIDCKVDKITYAFLKSNQANLTGITLLP